MALDPDAKNPVLDKSKTGFASKVLAPSSGLLGLVLLRLVLLGLVLLGVGLGVSLGGFRAGAAAVLVDAADFAVLVFAAIAGGLGFVLVFRLILVGRKGVAGQQEGGAREREEETEGLHGILWIEG